MRFLRTRIKERFWLRLARILPKEVRLSQKHLRKRGAGGTVYERRGDDTSKAAKGTKSRPQSVAFTSRAWTAMLSEVQKEIHTETGGILLGYRDGSDWLVVESIDPGPNSTFSVAFFEYDQPYVSHLANRVRRYYERPLEILGLWHRHPGSYDRFSGTDDGTNIAFARLDTCGAISGLINIDPNPRFTLFRVDADALRYTPIPYRVLSSVESERRAPLRELEALAHEIAEENAQGGLPRSVARPKPRPVSLSAMASRITAAIERRAEYLPDQGSYVDRLAEWSDEQLVNAIAIMEPDSQAFESCGITLTVQLVDTLFLEVVASDGRNQKLLCRLVLVEQQDGSGTAIYLMSLGEPSMFTQYTPGLLRKCASRQRS